MYETNLLKLSKKWHLIDDKLIFLYNYIYYGKIIFNILLIIMYRSLTIGTHLNFY